MAALRTRIRGQEAVLRQLHKMRTLQRPASGLLFAGPPGVGKTLVAWSSMQEVLCTEQVPSGACGSCGSCRKVENQSHESILKISTEGPTLKLDSLARLPGFLALRPSSSWQFVVIEEAEKLNPQAANVLLKSLEEPPERTSFLLISSQAARLLPTLLSRCQVLRFKPLSNADLRSLYPEAPDWAVRLSRGRVDLLQQWTSEDAEGVRQQMMDLFSRWWQGEDLAVKEFETYTKDRALMVQLLEFWQQMVRDTLGETSAGLQQRPFIMFESLQLALQDLGRNVDRSLVMENLLSTARGQDHPHLVL